MWMRNWARTIILFKALLWTSLTACQNQDFHSQDSHRTARLEAPRQEKPPEEPMPSDDSLPAGEDQPIFQNCEDDRQRAVIADLYRLPEQTLALPVFEELEPIKKVCLRQIDITDRDFTEGFPGVDDLVEWFALRLEFQIDVREAGLYQFDIASDDGSKLYINDELLIDNDGEHAVQEKSGSLPLEAGFHNITIEYFQGPRYRLALELFWTPPGQPERSYIPTQIMRRKPSLL